MTSSWYKSSWQYRVGTSGWWLCSRVVDAIGFLRDMSAASARVDNLLQRKVSMPGLYYVLPVGMERTVAVGNVVLVSHSDIV